MESWELRGDVEEGGLFLTARNIMKRVISRVFRCLFVEKHKGIRACLTLKHLDSENNGYPDPEFKFGLTCLIVRLYWSDLHHTLVLHHR